jgi:hypothetical protein
VKQQYNPRDFKSYQVTLKNDSTITPNQIYIFSLNEKYSPYDRATAINLNSSNDSEVKINFSKNFSLPKGNAININSQFEDFRVQNLGTSSIAINEIQITIYKDSKKEEKISKLVQGAQIISAVRSFL